MTEPQVIGEIKGALQRYNGKWGEKKGLWNFSAIIAERKAFLATKKLTYSARIRIDEAAKTVRFSEMLGESSLGLSTGGGMDDGMSTGFGFKSEIYNTSKGARQGTIEEQSKLFGKDYSYRFDFQELRSRVKTAAEKNGYQFEYQILPVK